MGVRPLTSVASREGRGRHKCWRAARDAAKRDQDKAAGQIMTLLVGAYQVTPKLADYARRCLAVNPFGPEFDSRHLHLLASFTTNFASRTLSRWENTPSTPLESSEGLLTVLSNE